MTRRARYGDHYHARTAANLLGIWANVPEEVVYYLGTRDSNGDPTVGGRRYSLTFPADSLPADQVDSYWSIILVGVPDYRVIKNPLDRYNFNDYSGLQYELDGSLQLDIAPTQCRDDRSRTGFPSPPPAGSH